MGMATIASRTAVSMRKQVLADLHEIKHRHQHRSLSDTVAFLIRVYQSEQQRRHKREN